MFPVSLALGQGLVQAHACWRLQAGRIGCSLVPAWPGHAQQHELPVGTALHLWVPVEGPLQGQPLPLRPVPVLSLGWPGQPPCRFALSRARGESQASGLSPSLPLRGGAGSGASAARGFSAPSSGARDVTLTLNGKSSPE